MSQPIDVRNERPARVELLAPAKNADFGIAAIVHGADAVYIGGPAFGARANAGNSVADVERLCTTAHRYNARVLVALNTILRDNELEDARRLAWQLHEAGADALIVQDMGLLEVDLPAIALHASTQTDIRTPEKARFLEDVGFSQMVLARELSLAQIRRIAGQTSATLEFFVHGSLCVSYSGLCNLSQASTGRSANRGDCSQACRLPYSLADADGRLVAQDQHLLSIKDNDQSANLAALIAAGIRSFKIEGRLKDLSYVKNITAHYRQLLDAIIIASPDMRRTSSGLSTFSFTPQADKTFNRGATDYFVNERDADLGAFASPKFVGKPIGEVTRIARDHFETGGDTALHNGDGISYFKADGELAGLRINRAEKIASGYRLFPAHNTVPGDLLANTTIYRNHDQAFERQLEKKSAERHIPLRIVLGEVADGFELKLTDDEGVSAVSRLQHAREEAQNGEQALAVLRANLGKLGGTIYRARSIELAIGAAWFLPASALNALRRTAVAALDAARASARRRPARCLPVEPPARYPDDALSYLGNVFNAKARAFYEKHGVSVIAAAYECGEEKGEVSLMITKHCLRYSFNLCPKQVKGLRPDPMILINGSEKLSLRFDCQQCEMHVIGKLKKTISLSKK